MQTEMAWHEKVVIKDISVGNITTEGICLPDFGTKPTRNFNPNAHTKIFYTPLHTSQLNFPLKTDSRKKIEFHTNKRSNQILSENKLRNPEIIIISHRLFIELFWRISCITEQPPF